MLPAVDKKSKYTFQKKDKLKSSIAIEKLFHANKFVLSYPIKCYFSFSEITEDKSTLQVAFTVPKKTFKKAVDRNTLKRRMREAYRLNYQRIFEPFITQNNKQVQLLIIYIGKEILDYRTIESNIQKLLQKLIEKIL